jgi:hypothetical protein
VKEKNIAARVELIYKPVPATGRVIHQWPPMAQVPKDEAKIIANWIVNNNKQSPCQTGFVCFTS